MAEIFVDCENILGEYITLIGVHSYGQERLQLHTRALTSRRLMKFIESISSGEEDIFLFCHGPDVGKIERFFGLELKSQFYCINTVTAFKRFTKYKDCSLKNLEECCGLPRRHNLSVFEISQLWSSGTQADRRIVLDYNWEDCLNLRKLVQILKHDYKVTKGDFKDIAMY